MQRTNVSAKVKPSNNIIFFLDELYDSIDQKLIITNYKNNSAYNSETSDNPNDSPENQLKLFQQYKNNTENFEKHIAAVIIVTSISELLKIINLASKYLIQIYPISCGNNWGYGTKLPVCDNNVILDLSSMNSIVEFNEEHGYVILEPGVTQLKLSNFLKQQQSRFHYDATGAGPNASVVGNALERGFGLGLHADHYDAISGLEVMLANGEILRTGFWNFTDSSIAHCYKWGLGPHLTGLFTQSNFGIITKMCVWLTAIPESIDLVCIKIENTHSMSEQISKLRELFENKLLPSGFNIASSTRLMTTYTKYPWEIAHNETPLSDKLKKQLEKKFRITPWTIFIPVRGTIDQVKVQKKEIKKRLVKTAHYYCVSRKSISYFEKLPSLLKSKIPLIKQTLGLRPFFNFLLGEPQEFTLASPYWRNRANQVPDSCRDPARDNCGLIWFAPTLPFSDSAIKQFIEIVAPILEEYGFDDLFSFLYANNRSIICTLPIIFDATSDLETEAAHLCYKELSKKCFKAGFIVYRCNIMNMPDYQNENYQKLLAKIKFALDPKGILSKGRYV